MAPFLLFLCFFFEHFLKKLSKIILKIVCNVRIMLKFCLKKYMFFYCFLHEQTAFLGCFCASGKKCHFYQKPGGTSVKTHLSNYRIHSLTKISQNHHFLIKTLFFMKNELFLTPQKVIFWAHLFLKTHNSTYSMLKN